MHFFLPAGSARLERPKDIYRYTFEDFVGGVARRIRALRTPAGIVALEAVAPGDLQVLAAQDLKSVGTGVMNLDMLADFPSVESVLASAAVGTERELPHLKELLLDSHAPMPNSATLRRLTGLESLYALPPHGSSRLDLDSLPAEQMRKLAVSRWFVRSMTGLERMTGMRKLRLDVFREPLDAVSRMQDLDFLYLKGPAKGWAKLRECAHLEEAIFIEVQVANLRRWNTWRRLRTLTLAGRGVRSLSGLENCQSLEELTLINLSMEDLSPLRDLPNLRKLTLRMADPVIDFDSIGTIAELKSFTISSSARDEMPVRLPTLKPLASAWALEELALRETIVGDADLSPLANLPKLRKVQLGPTIGADVQVLRDARPDLEVLHVAPDPQLAMLKELVGEVTIIKPGGGSQGWSIFQSLAPAMGLATNYDAERRIRNEVKRRAPELVKRLEWDTESGAVAICASKEEDIREVAAIINQLLAVVRGHR